MSIIFFRILTTNKNKPNSSKGICTGQIRADQVVKKAIKYLYFICIYLYFSFEMEIIVILPCLLHEQGPHSLRIIIKKVLKLYTMSTKDSVGKIIHALESNFRSFTIVIERSKNKQWASSQQSSPRDSLTILLIFIYFWNP